MTFLRNSALAIIAIAINLVAGAPDAIADGPEIVVRLSTTNQTTNTISTGAAVKNLGLLENELKKIDRFKGRTIRLEWSNFTTGPQMTNLMLGGKLDFAVMGDYPLVINAMTLAPTENATRLIGTTGYNVKGAGNGIVVRSDSSLRDIKDLAGKSVAVAFGSSAYGMLLKALRDHNIDQSSVTILNQGMEVAAVNLREGKIDALAAYVPFADLLPFRGGVRTLYEGALIGFPTWHGIVVRNEFAQAYPEIVDAYLRAIVEANKWIARDPVSASLKLSEWTGVEAEAIYLIDGPAGVMTLDLPLRPKLIDALGYVRSVLGSLGNKGNFEPKTFVEPKYLEATYRQLGLPYQPDVDPSATVVPSPRCATKTAEAAKSMQIWFTTAGMETATDLDCLAIVAKTSRGDGKIRAAYVTDKESGSRTFGQLATFVIPPPGGSREIIAFTRSEAAAAEATRSGGKALTFEQLMAASAR